ncbi:hypothetical protein [Nocardia sp. NPDC020380]|uniref:hypothetical protein n=1 Tax=Nocardia sp. NPDC020380 TaxID=3364309 RepID=UPI0037AF4802
MTGYSTTVTRFVLTGAAGSAASRHQLATEAAIPESMLSPDHKLVPSNHYLFSTAPTVHDGITVASVRPRVSSNHRFTSTADHDGPELTTTIELTLITDGDEGATLRPSLARPAAILNR